MLSFLFAKPAHASHSTKSSVLDKAKPPLVSHVTRHTVQVLHIKVICLGRLALFALVDRSIHNSLSSLLTSQHPMLPFVLQPMTTQLAARALSDLICFAHVCYACQCPKVSSCYACETDRRSGLSGLHGLGPVQAFVGVCQVLLDAAARVYPPSAWFTNGQPFLHPLFRVTQALPEKGGHR
eukprot:6464634-Amphidinium_carterae.1